VTARAALRTVGALLIAAVTLAVLPLRGQGQGNIPRIGVLVFRPRAVSRLPAVFPRALRELGYEDGRNVRLEFRYAEGREDRVADIAAELVRLNVAVLVSEDTPAAHALKNATSTIPIVIISGDPVGTGLVSSLARPGGNVTGVMGTGAEIAGKGLQLFRELLPRATRMGLLASRTDPFSTPFREQNRQAAASLKIQLQELVVSEPGEVDAALATLVKANVQGLVVQPTLATPQLAEMTLRARLPTMAASIPFVRVGGLMSYAPDRDNLYEKMATQVDKILKGVRPAELPIERPTKFEFAINVKTAKALGLTIPQAVLLQADHVIQ
jgi:putative ABC transport system substrate-binding protein